MIEVCRIWWISIEASVLCHQSRPHFGMGKVKYRLAVSEASVIATLGR